MAAKMAVYYRQYKKISPKTMKLQEFACKMLIFLFLSYRYHPCNIPVMQLIHHSEFDIFKMVSRMVADEFYKPVGAASNL